jgi:hypothetical protein
MSTWSSTNRIRCYNERNNAAWLIKVERIGRATVLSILNSRFSTAAEVSFDRAAAEDLILP